jgi:hypothetical protein
MPCPDEPRPLGVAARSRFGPVTGGDLAMLDDRAPGLKREPTHETTARPDALAAFSSN